MDKKQLWTTIVVALIVAVIASLVTMSVAKDVLLSPTARYTIGGGGSSTVSANSCDADATCEVNELLVVEEIFTDSVVSQGTDLNLNSPGNLYLTAGGQSSFQLIPGKSAVYAGNIVAETLWLRSPNNGSIGAGFLIGDDPEGPGSPKYITMGDNNSGTLSVSDSITVASMSSNSTETGYVCVNANGQFIRSSTPCA